MTSELPSKYDPKAAQEWCLTFWSERGYFHSDPDRGRREKKPPFCIVIPPPNVTGALHMGHALDETCQDVLIRWRRMQGYETLWMPGTDHAGIATQAVVEKRMLETENKTRHDVGREGLVERIWKWKDQYEARILGQLKQLGCSADWRRTRFTLDDQCSRAVRQTFFNLFKAGLIYRGKRLVNWDTHLQTAVADDEIYHEKTKGHFWTFKYPVIDDTGQPTGQFITFSTTRPETMLADVAVAVHPDDERYKHLHGKQLLVPTVGRRIPVITDGQLVDPALGTGAVKVTPAHDPNDYQCGLRHKLPMLSMMLPDGTISDVGGKYAGMKMADARKAVVADMEAMGYLEKIEDREIDLAHSDRSKTPIEPFLSDQWFVKMGDPAPLSPPGRGVGGEGDSLGSAAPSSQSEGLKGAPSPPAPLPGGERGERGLAQLAMDAVTSGRVNFFPERYAKTYLDWLGEKRDWCISRQLWWGHRIPVWRQAKIANFDDPDTASLPDKLQQWEKENRVAYKHRNIRDFWATFTQEEREDAPKFFVCIRDQNDREVISALEQNGFFVQDPDVLDTWFSSGLWPHSTMGWPGPAFPDQPTGPQNPEWSEMRYYYPTSVLVTGRDIITLWVARMVMMSLANLGEVPFRHVYIHPKVLDGFGETMSKSKGNGVDPLDVIDFYGTDALRFVIASMATETQDARLPVANVCPHCQTLVPVKNEHMYMRTRKINCPSCKKPFRPGGPWPSPDAELPTAKQTSEKFELGRNFATKLWNASRFVLMNLGEGDRSQETGDRMGATGGSSASANRAGAGGAMPTPVPTGTKVPRDDGVGMPQGGNLDASQLKLEDRWILSRLATVSDQVTKHLEGYELASAARLLYDFTWSEFCDWYVEMAKSRLKDPAERPLAQRMLAGVLDVILRLLHPIMPFVTEMVWQALNQAAPQRGLLGAEQAAESVMIAPWPRTLVEFRDPGRELHVARMQELVKLIRNARNEYRVDERTAVTVSVKCSPQVAGELQPLTPFIQSLAKVSTLNLGADVQRPAQAAAGVHADFTAYVHLAGLIDVAAEVKRLEKQLGEKEKQLSNLKAKLANQGFLAKAPAEVVAELRESEKATEQQLAVLRENLVTLR